MAARGALVFVVVALAPLLACAAMVPVPVLCWSSVKIAATPAHGGHTVTAKEVASLFHEAVAASTKGAAVLFIQDELSMSDITRFGGVHGESTSSFNFVKAAFEHATSSFAFATVGDKHSNTATVLMESLFTSTRGTASPFYIPSSGISSFNFKSLDATSFNVVVVELPSVVSNGVVSPALLAHNDELVEFVLNSVRAQAGGDLSVMLTARSSDSVKTRSVDLSRRGVTFSPFSGGIFPAFTGAFLISPLLVNYERPYLYFTIPLFMGVGMFLIFLFFVLFGVYGVSLTQTSQRWADVNDKNLQVPAQ